MSQFVTFRQSALFAAIIASLVLPSPVASYEPPRTSPKDALAQGRVALIGRVIAIEEVEHSPHASQADLTLKVLEPLYGTTIESGETVRIRYHSRLFSGYPRPGFEARFSVSTVVLVIFNRAQAERALLVFNNFLSGIDLAYVFDDTPPHNFSLDRPLQHLTSVYPLPWSGTISTSDLRAWSAERAAALVESSP